MLTSTSLRWLVVAVSAAMLLAVAAACAGETVEVPGETVVVEKVVTETVEVPGETVVVEKEVVRTVEVPGETVTKEVIKEVQVPGETVVVEKEVVKTVEVPGETVVVEKEVVKEVRAGYVTDPTTGKVVTAPQYGGTLTTAICYGGLADGPDTGSAGGAAVASSVIEKLTVGDWGLDRDVYAFRTVSFTPEVAYTGSLAESWDISPDERTFTFNIREGVNWHDKAPMNGRELTAYDVEFNYHRITGTGSGYTEPTPKQWLLPALSFESITATDNSTLVVKLNERYFGALVNLTDDAHTFMYPPEVIQEHGDVNDWNNLVGTGPYEFTDWVEGSSITFAKSPNYWGYDEKYPENRLPYMDQLEVLVIIDPATRLAAIRTGKVDALFGSVGCAASLDDFDSLQRSNPEIVAWPYYQRSNYSFSLNVTEPPFDDIRVRHAMQMALDHEAISNAFWKGYAYNTPQGLLSNKLTEWTTPFEEWPKELQGYYTYDPERAEELLDEAGYPRGPDGIRFKTNMDALDYIEVVDYYQAAADYYARVGIEVEVQVTSMAEVGAWLARFEDQGYGGMAMGWGAQVGDLLTRVTDFHSTLHEQNLPGVNDPDYDAIIEAAFAAPTIEELQRLVKEADMYGIEQHWQLWGPIAPDLILQQPWLTGYNGEVQLANTNATGALWGRLWIDHELKKAMGY